MKNIVTKAIIISIVLAIIIPSSVNAKTLKNEKPILFLPEAMATLYYATERDGYLENFTLNINGSILHFSTWRNVDNPTYKPKLLYKDINQDGRKELIVLLTTDTGTGINVQNVHVIHKDWTSFEQIYNEILVDNPIAILLKNIKTKLTESEAIITIGDRKTIIQIDKLEIDPKHIFSDISIGNLLNFDVVNGKLTAIVGVNVSPAGGLIGYLHITYIFKDKMYQMKEITFQKLEGL
jgi:hypothetical protein